MIAQILAILAPLIEGLMGKYGIIVQIVAIMGTFRLIFKPFMLFVEAAVAATPTKADDAAVAMAEASPIFKGIVFLLDWVGSLKLPTILASLK